MPVGAVVNPADGHLRHNGGLAARIVRAGSESIQRDSDTLVRSQGPVQPGRIAITGPGNLPCRLIIHAVGPIYDYNQHDTSCRVLREAVKAAIQHASRTSHAQMPLRSIALPTISAGVFEFPIQACATEIVKTIMPLIHSQTLNLQEICLVRGLEATVKVLRDALKGYVRPSKTTTTHRTLPVIVEDASDDHVPVRTQKVILDKEDPEPFMYIKFTPG
ncbi:protein mono-ADP-ribosyltransferase PARP9-like [Anomaloglossus baeobatrachus]|uniref:protein mono-ADP-ribosyltransferase PARP9-like n=1 Tax=Anomaloglossus baeobatrachus TaxID=238106 RepID=UPI003F509853